MKDGFAGYYSVVKYIPDTVRQESANIGVILTCPDRSWTDAKFLRPSQMRQAAFVLAGLHGKWHNLPTGQALHIGEAAPPSSIDQLRQLHETSGNKLIFSAPLPCTVGLDPAPVLDHLFLRFVGRRARLSGSNRTAVVKKISSFLKDSQVLQYLTDGPVIQDPIGGTIEFDWMQSRDTTKLIYVMNHNARSAQDVERDLYAWAKHLDCVKNMDEWQSAQWYFPIEPRRDPGERNMLLSMAKDLLGSQSKVSLFRADSQEQLEALANGLRVQAS